MKKVYSLLKNLLCRDYYFIFSIWVIATFVCGILKYNKNSYNNYLIFKNVFWHAIYQLPLYNPYPQEYSDITHYGVFFSSVIFPFSILPNVSGLILWLLANACFLYYAIRKLPLKINQHLFIYLFCVSELFTSLTSQQFNIAIAGIIILTYHFVEKKKDFWAAFFIMLGTFTKIYGIVGLAFFPFSRDKKRFIFSCVFWSLFIFLFPMLYTSPSYVWTQYHSWIIDIIGKNSQNLFAYYQNISFLGFVRKVSGSSNYSDLWLIFPCIVLFCLPYLRIKQYSSLSFRMLILASTLLFVVLFSTSSESCSYIIALIGVAIWYIKTPSQSRSLNLFLLIFAFLLTGLSSTDLFPSYLRKQYVFPFALKSLPCMLVWLKICYELCFLDFCLKEDSSKSNELFGLAPNRNNKIDIILPCYNPRANWQDIIHDKMGQVNKMFPDKNFHLIVVNDGSTINMNHTEIERFVKLMPEATFISYTENKGKGYALREGIKTSQSSMTIYTDWDFPYDEESLRAVVYRLEEGYDVVIAARNNSYFHHADLNAFRSLMSISSRVLNQMVLGLKFCDAQGGLKGMSNKGKGIFMKTKIDQFLFDTEFVYMASRERDLHICEVRANIREGVQLSFMGLSILRTELTNFVRIINR
ncbi:glycosyltransferase 87 family protein [uncultured Bacteroides sp.]|uniref:glycosyltransferase 87 family protein n=1 Tax=uncultured Bacteroides sp. TaxID=162156 RepID=UPI002AABC85D|nr:glycosyltransferase 87 family protein [uncultured Bacteroides sp.]